jgi:hypothetical protein
MQTPVYFCEQAKAAKPIRGPRETITILCGPGIGFYQGRKFYWLEQWTTGGSTKRMGNLSSAFEKADRHWEQIFKGLLGHSMAPNENNFSQYVSL